jgi:Aspartate-ammonia ligase
MVLQQYPAVFIIGIGWPLADGYPHEMRAADYDYWITDTSTETGGPTHGLNGDILVWNHVTMRRHELTSMGIRVTAQTLRCYRPRYMTTKRLSCRMTSASSASSRDQPSRCDSYVSRRMSAGSWAKPVSVTRSGVPSPAGSRVNST